MFTLLNQCKYLIYIVHLNLANSYVSVSHVEKNIKITWSVAEVCCCYAEYPIVQNVLCQCSHWCEIKFYELAIVSDHVLRQMTVICQIQLWTYQQKKQNIFILHIFTQLWECVNSVDMK